ncbi:MAG TPA: uroporphyrinogen-III synthase [Pusillimonas sp.]|uniref:uroporphyrinogen-III synthase n=1 Tax=Pusillimonas sp. TaxID=3040095 RepID=UPI002C90CAFD|nr:uroporphyrinogen-III synthase [Pusillimonas sp.]HUH88863.1 uroporphyrinogen-III synthase [Pusillimonas sp.]
MPQRVADALIVLTRPQGRNETLAQELAQLGLKPLLMPVLQIRPAAVQGTLPTPEHYDLVVFVSGNAVVSYFHQLDQAVTTPRPWPEHGLVGVVGAATAAAVERTGRVPSQCIVRPDEADEQDSESLWRVLQPKLAQVRNALIVRGQEGREWLGGQLEDAGIQVHRHTAYQREPLDWEPMAVRQLQHASETGQPVICLLTSAHSVQVFVDNARRHNLLPALAAFRYVVIHPRVAGRLQSSLGAASGKVDKLAVTICQPTDEAVLQAVKSLASL